MQKLLLVYYHSENPKLRHKPNLQNTSKYGFSPDLGGKNGGVLSMRMQVILNSSFARPGSAPIWGGKKGEFRDWTTARAECMCEILKKTAEWKFLNLEISIFFNFSEIYSAEFFLIFLVSSSVCNKKIFIKKIWGHRLSF